VIVMLALLTLMLVFISFNLRTLYSLNRELKLTEQRQLRRLDGLAVNAAPLFPSADTNTSPAAHPK